MTWADGFEQYVRSSEVLLHKRRTTFGGRVWKFLPKTFVPTPRQLEIAIQAQENTERVHKPTG